MVKQRTGVSRDRVIATALGHASGRLPGMYHLPSGGIWSCPKCDYNAGHGEWEVEVEYFCPSESAIFAYRITRKGEVALGTPSVVKMGTLGPGTPTRGSSIHAGPGSTVISGVDGPVLIKGSGKLPQQRAGSLQSMPPVQSRQTLTIREKIKEVVEKNWAYGQPFSRGELINKVQEAYPEIKKNGIMPADKAVNKRSEYNKTDGGWEKKDQYLFARDDSKYERYDPLNHGTFECIDDGNGYKEIIKKVISTCPVRGSSDAS